MSRRSATRLLVLTAVVLVVVVDVVLFAHLFPTITSPLGRPAAARAPRSTPTAAPTPIPAPAGVTTGTYWTCESNEADQSTVLPNASPPAGAVTSPLCNSDYGRQGPGQPQPQLPTGIQIWRVPAGTFTPYGHCGVTVVNVVDPYDPQAAPATWPERDKLLYDANWNRVPSGRC